MEGNQTRFSECSNSDIKKLVATAIPESTKKSTKYAVNVFEGKQSHRLLKFSPKQIQAKSFNNIENFYTVITNHKIN